VSVHVQARVWAVKAWWCAACLRSLWARIPKALAAIAREAA
jgi:hypothetical protein